MAAHDFDRAGHATVDAAIICMIADTELRAIREVLRAHNASEIDLTGPSRGEYYYNCARVEGSPLRLVVACCDGQSNLEAALTTQILLFRHNPRFVFLCGIAGGLKIDKVRLGDVVIAPEVVYRRYTKIENGTFKAEVFNVPPSDGGRRLAQRFLSSDVNVKDVPSPLNDGEVFAIHQEKILSWDLVLDDPGVKADLLDGVDRQLAVVEIEGAGFLKAVESHAKHFILRPWQRAGSVDALIVRGLSDPAAGKADSDAGQKPWRRIAARNAAQTVLLILGILKDRDFGATPSEPAPSPAILQTH